MRSVPRHTPGINCDYLRGLIKIGQHDEDVCAYVEKECACVYVYADGAERNCNEQVVWNNYHS